MANSGDSSLPRPTRGQKVTIEAFRKVADAVPRRIVGNAVNVTSSPDGVAISAQDARLRRPWAPVPGTVTGTTTNPDAATEGDFVLVDLYGNGRKAPATQSVKALSVDPTNVPSSGNVAAFRATSGQYYVVVTGGGGGEFPAKVKNVDPLTSDPTVYQVDLYGNGFASDPTATGVTAYSVDDVSINFAVDNEVSVYLSGGKYYVASVRPYAQVVPAQTKFGKITANNGGGSYFFKEVTDTAGGSFVVGATDTLCKEHNSSAFVSVGAYVCLTNLGTGWRFNFFLGSNS